MNIHYIYLITLAVLVSCNTGSKQSRMEQGSQHEIKAVNHGEIQAGLKTIAIVGATIIDGNGGDPVLDGCVLIKGSEIAEVGSRQEVKIPTDAEIVEAEGMSIMPGFIDSHFHLDRVKGLPAQFLQHGVTSLRDPGAWIESYDEERKSGKMMPRLFLTGPHLDNFPPAYPYDAYVVRDEYEAARQVNDLVDEGATAVKVYFRISPGLIKVICQTAHERGVPVTAHLEITEAMKAIEAGLDGVEHITSFGLSLVPKREGEKYRQGMLGDNNFRREGRYDMWKDIDINSVKADSLIQFLVRKGTFVSPTLGPFEYQAGDGIVDSAKLIGFNNMKALTARFEKSGVHIVLGSHSMVPYAEQGWAYQREMELWVESGIPNAAVIAAATMENARYFRIDDRLGSIEKGKIADLVLVKGNPLLDIMTVRNIERVMLNGVWVPQENK